MTWELLNNSSSSRACTPSGNFAFSRRILPKFSEHQPHRENAKSLEGMYALDQLFSSSQVQIGLAFHRYCAIISNGSSVLASSIATPGNLISR